LLKSARPELMTLCCSGVGSSVSVRRRDRHELQRLGAHAGRDGHPGRWRERITQCGARARI